MPLTPRSSSLVRRHAPSLSSLVATASALGAPPPTAAPPPPRLFLLLAFPSLVRRSPPSESRTVPGLQDGMVRIQEAFPTRRRLLLAASSPAPLLLLPPPSLVTTSTSPLSPSSADPAAARISQVEAGEEGRGESRAYRRKQQGWVERPMRMGSAVEEGCQPEQQEQGVVIEAFVFSDLQIGYKWFSKEGVCNCNRDKAMEEECVAGLCKFSPIEGQGVAASWICREEEVLVAEDGAHGKSSERHSHGGMADVKVWIVGEKVGEGVGETRKEAQTTSC